jgi:membrane protein required for colicin V production
LSTLDIALCLIILIGAFNGFKTGFLIEIFSLFAILLGVLLGFKLMGTTMLWIENKIDVDEKTLPYVAFFVVFIAIIIIVHLLSKLIVDKLHTSPVGVVDRVAGAGVAIFRTAFMLSIMLWISDSMKYDFPEKWTTDSYLLPKVAEFAPHTAHWIASFIPFFGDVF